MSSHRWIERWTVESHTNPDKGYIVSRADDEETWGCSCPAWKFQRRRLRDGICKHIREVQNMIDTDTFTSPESHSHIQKDEFFTEEEFTL